MPCSPPPPENKSFLQQGLVTGPIRSGGGAFWGTRAGVYGNGEDMAWAAASADLPRQLPTHGRGHLDGEETGIVNTGKVVEISYVLPEEKGSLTHVLRVRLRSFPVNYFTSCGGARRDQPARADPACPWRVPVRECNSHRGQRLRRNLYPNLGDRSHL